MKALLAQHYGYCDNDQRLSAHDLGDKHYEFNNHLGNVLVVVFDKTIPQISGGVINYLDPEIISISDYYPFGMSYQPKPCEGRQISERSQSAPNLNYRYGFGGHEKDNEMKGSGNYLSFGSMGYDSRLGRRWRQDRFFQLYPDISPYTALGNNPIFFQDSDGNILRDPNGSIVYTNDGEPFWVIAFGQALLVQNAFIYTNEGEEVSVQMVIDIRDYPSGESAKDGTTKNTYICHGYSMTDGKFIPNSEHAVSNTLVLDKMGRNDLAPNEVKDNLELDFSKIQDGDILVIYKDQYNSRTGEMEEGVVIHTAVWSEEKECISQKMDTMK